MRSKCVLFGAVIALVLCALFAFMGTTAYAAGYDNSATARDGSGHIEGTVDDSSGSYYAYAADQNHKIVTANSASEAETYAFALPQSSVVDPVLPAYSTSEGATGSFTLLVNPTDLQLANAMAASSSEDFDAKGAVKQVKKLVYAALVDPVGLKDTYGLNDGELWEIVSAELERVAAGSTDAKFTGDMAKARKDLIAYMQGDGVEKAADFKNLELHLYLAYGDSPQGMVNLVAGNMVAQPEEEKPVDTKAKSDKKGSFSIDSSRAGLKADITVEQYWVDGEGLVVDWPADEVSKIELVDDGEATGKKAELTASAPLATFEQLALDRFNTFTRAGEASGIAYAWGGNDAGYTIVAVDGDVPDSIDMQISAEFIGVDGVTPVTGGLPESIEATISGGDDDATVKLTADDSWKAKKSIEVSDGAIVCVSGEAIDGFDLVMTKGDVDGSFTLVYQQKSYILPIGAVDEDGKPVSDAGLLISGTDSTGLPTSATATTSSQQSTVLLPAGSYKLQQVDDPEGYKARSDVNIKLAADEDDDTATVETDPDAVGDTGATDGATSGSSVNITEQATDDAETFTVAVWKVDAAEFDGASDKSSIKGLKDAKLSITGKDAAGAAITEITWTSNDGSMGYEAKLPAGTFKLSETEAPAGYIKAADITITVAEDGTVTSDAYDKDLDKIVMKDQKTKVVFSKRETGKTTELSGAKLAVVDTSNKEVASWTTTTRKRAVNALPIGEYRLVEKMAPTGYNVADPIKFRVNEDGSVECYEKSAWKKVEEVVMYDEANGIKHTKQPVTNGGSNKLAKTGDENGLLGLGVIALLGAALVIEGAVLARRRKNRG